LFSLALQDIVPKPKSTPYGVLFYIFAHSYYTKMEYLKERLEQLGYKVIRIDKSRLITHDHNSDLIYSKDGNISSIMIYNDDTLLTVVKRIQNKSTS